MFQDLRYGVRLMLRNPVLTVITTLTLALGIGATTAIFTVIDAALLRPLPFRDPERLVHLWEKTPQKDFSQREASYPDYEDWRRENHVFEDLAGYSAGQGFVLTGRDAPERLVGARVTAGFFHTLGVEPALGRMFLPEEDQARGELPLILSYGLWQRRFGSDPGIIGEHLRLNDRPYEVVGVLPSDFQFAPAYGAEIWIPMVPSISEKSRRFFHWIHIIARLRPGIGFEQAQAEMTLVARGIEAAHPDSHSGVGIRLVPLRDQILGAVRPLLLIAMGAVCFVLLIACANVANLLLVRAQARHREVAVRMALGAGRRRLLRQFLTESVLVALCGGLLGLIWSYWGIKLLVAAIPAAQLRSMPYLQDLRINTAILGFTGAVSLFTGILFGLAPALQTSRMDLQEALKEGGRSSADSARRGVRNLLVVAEVALALMLLVGAGLLMKSFVHLMQVDPGFKTEHLLTLEYSLPDSRYPDSQRVIAFNQQLAERASALPGVRAVGSTDQLPLLGGGTIHVLVEGRPAPPPGSEFEVNVREVSPGYFNALEAPLVRGRDFTGEDREGTPNVVIINQTLASRLFPDQDPIGQRLRASVEHESNEIVGVVSDLKESTLDASNTPVVYEPFLQHADPTMSLVVRTSSDPAAAVPAIQGEARALDPDLPLYAIMTIDQLIARSPSTFIRRYPALLIGVFAVIALVLAAGGIYGVMSYAVAQRTHEIGIRMALGAGRTDVLKLVFRQGMSLAAIGVALGLLGAFAVTRVLSGLLYGVSASDPPTFALVTAILAAVALLACYVPARRATRVDPMIALRYE